MNEFVIEANSCLDRDTKAYYHYDYVGYQKSGNPDFINDLKNQFNNFSNEKLSLASLKLKDILETDLIKFGRGYTICVVPRAKAQNTYSRRQLGFKYTINRFLNNNISIFENGVDYIIRHTNTRTTHLKGHDMDGAIPYKGITKDTCFITNVQGKKIILIDDIYTKTVNIDEDCIQALYDNGADEVLFYAVAKTVEKY